MKKKLIGVLIGIALLIPLVIAIVDYNYLKNTPIERRTITAITVTDPLGDKFEIKKGDKNASAEIERFDKLNESAKEVDSLPELFAQSTPFAVKYDSYSLSSDCKYYFALDQEESYYVNGEGKVYKISPAETKRFLCSYYARSLYSGTAVPVLSLSGSDDVVPATVKWTFRDVEGEYIDYAGSYRTSKANTTYELSSDFGMRFSVAPDFFNITVTQEGAVLYDGNYDTLSIGAVDLEKTAEIDIKAEWYEALDRPYAGSMTYKFTVNLVPPPSFSAVMSDGDYVSNGGVVILTGKNVRDPSSITVTCTPDLGYTPKWFANSETGSVYALVPVRCDADVQQDKINFVIDAGGTRIALDCKFEKENYSSLANVKEITFDAEYTDICSKIPDPEDGTVYFDGLFANPVSAMTGIKGYGRLVDNLFRHNGADFTEVTTGASVFAGAGGKVVYIGALSPNQTCVVIEHGLGLRSWYVGLATVNAEFEVGSQVSAGDVVGTCMTGQPLHCSVTVFDVPVSPYKFWTKYAENPDFLKLK